MRPPKKVLLYCEDEGELSRVGYALWVRGYQVLAAAAVAHALRHATEGGFDCSVLISVAGGESTERSLAELQAALPDTPTLLALKIPAEAASLASVLHVGWDMGGIAEVLRILCSRKRGPKTANGVRQRREWAQSASTLQRVG